MICNDSNKVSESARRFWFAPP